MPQHRKRPSPGPRLEELIRLRKLKYPGMRQKHFATEILKITRLHMYAIEDGRRNPSMDLALRWVKALAPDATLEMFGKMPFVEHQLRQAKYVAAIAPDYFKAA